MLTKLVDQCSRTSLNIVLTWVNMTCNPLQMWYGYSSYQLLFGTNPNIRNIMTDYIQSEADERIRRALQHKIRAAKLFFNPNDCVFYKHEGHNKWLGPVKITFQGG